MNLKEVPFEPESLVSGTFIWVLMEFVKEGLLIINGPGQQLPVPMTLSPGIGHSAASDKEENVSSDWLSTLSCSSHLTQQVEEQALGLQSASTWKKLSCYLSIALKCV